MEDQTSPGQIWQPWIGLYGSPDGRWYLMAGPHGTTPPSTVDGVGYLGPPPELIRLVDERWRTAGRGSQRKLADLLGVRQQSISRYLNGSERVHLSGAGWERLVVEVFCVGGPVLTPSGPIP